MPLKGFSLCVGELTLTCAMASPLLGCHVSASLWLHCANIGVFCHGSASFSTGRGKVTCNVGVSSLVFRVLAL